MGSRSTTLMSSWPTQMALVRTGTLGKRRARRHSGNPFKVPLPLPHSIAGGDRGTVQALPQPGPREEGGLGPGAAAVEARRGAGLPGS